MTKAPPYEYERISDNAANFKPLIGESIVGVAINTRGDAMEFKLESGNYITFHVEGEWWTSSYFHDFIGISAIFNSPIQAINSIELTDEAHKDLETEYEAIKFYGYRFQTETASAVLSFRNESNGYYGGYLEDFYWVSSQPNPEYQPIELTGGSWLND